MGEKLSLVVADVIYGKSPDPDISENQTIDFQDGYAVGLSTDDALNEITLEYQRRGVCYGRIHSKNGKEGCGPAHGRE